MEKHVSRSPLGRLNIVTMSISLKLMYIALMQSQAKT